MPITMRVSQPGYDALTDTTIDHYSIYADSDNVLIKETIRGTINVALGAIGTVTHNLGYIPFAMVFVNGTANFGSTSWHAIGAANISVSYYAALTTTNLLISNNFLGTQTFKYYIFYDQQV